MAELDRDGVSIHYDVKGDGPAVLLTHGFTATSHMFGLTAEALQDDFQIITWDIRGHGRSDSPDDQARYTVPLAVEDMVAVLDAAGADAAVVGGHSLGGFLSLELHLAHPDRVRGLVLIDTGPGYRSDDARQGWNDRAERTAARLEERGLDALGSSSEVDATRHPHGAAGLARAARGILTQRDGRVIESLPSISVPTLIVVGDQDEPFLAGSGYMAKKIPGAELVVIDGAGHAPMIDQPAAFTATLHEFLRTV
jgi:pimeloyl-ACP methyl ester carboxylesterase